MFSSPSTYTTEGDESFIAAHNALSPLPREKDRQTERQRDKQRLKSEKSVVIEELEMKWVKMQDNTVCDRLNRCNRFKACYEEAG